MVAVDFVATFTLPRYLQYNILDTSINSLVYSEVNYCNSLLAGVQGMGRLKSVQKRSSCILG